MKLQSLEPEILQAMISKAEEKLASARISFESGFYDDASSRAYYSAFHAVSAALGARGLVYSSHGQTLGAFNKEFVKTGVIEQEAFRRLQKLFANRQIGDYDASSSIDRDQAKRDLDEARWIVDRCKALMNLCPTGSE